MSLVQQRALARVNARAAMAPLNGGGRALQPQFDAVADPLLQQPGAPRFANGVPFNPFAPNANDDDDTPQLNTPVKAVGRRPRGD